MPIYLLEPVSLADGRWKDNSWLRPAIIGAADETRARTIAALAFGTTHPPGETPGAPRGMDPGALPGALPSAEARISPWSDPRLVRAKRIDPLDLNIGEHEQILLPRGYDEQWRRGDASPARETGRMRPVAAVQR